MSNLSKKSNSLINSYYEYLELIKKYKDKYKDKNTQADSKIDIKSLILEYLKFKFENGEKMDKIFNPNDQKTSISFAEYINIYF